MKPPQERQLVLVANAHMHWDPEYSDVKLIQTMMFLSELKSIAERASGSVATGSPTSDPSSIPIVLCADLNSLPDSGKTVTLTSPHSCRRNVTHGSKHKHFHLLISLYIFFLFSIKFSERLKMNPTSCVVYFSQGLHIQQFNSNLNRLCFLY